MSEEKKDAELKDEQLNSVSGGFVGIPPDGEKYPWPKFVNVSRGQCPHCQHICRFSDGSINYSRAYDKYYCAACGEWSDTIWTVAHGL